MTLGELIETLGGKLAQGNPQLDIDGVSSSGFASPSELIFAENEAFAAKALNSFAGAVVIPAGCVRLTRRIGAWSARPLPEEKRSSCCLSGARSSGMERTKHEALIQLAYSSATFGLNDPLGPTAEGASLFMKVGKGVGIWIASFSRPCRVKGRKIEK